VPIQIAAHHVELSNLLRRRIRRKAQHMLRVFDGVVTIHVTLSAEKERRVVEFVANVSHGAPVVAKVTADSLEVAIKDAIAKVEAQLRRHKDKVRDHRPREGGPQGPPAAAQGEPADEADEGDEADEPWASEESGTTDADDADTPEKLR
jgi:putative sigma-54 modulation protein